MYEAIKISVIIPVYNGEKYLSECIKSVCTQTLREIEIIVIDDGSNDRSIAIIEEFASGDSRIKIIQQINAGVSAARNKGLQAAMGAWIAFADADDWMETDMLEKMYAGAVESGSDMSICNVCIVSDNESHPRLTLLKDVTTLSGEKGVKNMMSFTYDYANWNKLYNAGIIRDHNVRFFHGMKIWEDLLFNLQYISYTNKAWVTDELLYHYRVHENSVMAGSQISLTFEYNKLYEQYVSFAQQKGLTQELFAFRQAMAKSFYNHHLPAFVEALQQSTKNSLVFVQKLTAMLHNVHKGIFFFPKKHSSRLQQFKQSLLKRGNFFTFSVLAMLMNRYKKTEVPYANH